MKQIQRINQNMKKNLKSIDSLLNSVDVDDPNGPDNKETRLLRARSLDKNYYAAKIFISTEKGQMVKVDTKKDGSIDF